MFYLSYYSSMFKGFNHIIFFFFSSKKLGKCDRKLYRFVTSRYSLYIVLSFMFHCYLLTRRSLNGHYSRSTFIHMYFKMWWSKKLFEKFLATSELSYLATSSTFIKQGALKSQPLNNTWLVWSWCVSKSYHLIFNLILIHTYINVSSLAG